MRSCRAHKYSTQCVDTRPRPRRRCCPHMAELYDRDETILVVDDDHAVRALITAILRSEGWSVIQASDGQDALDVVEIFPQPIAAVVSDVFMPRLGGVELFVTLRGWYPGIRFLLMSGYPEY